ncbi:MAG: aspartate/glutamate racemase family protein, partial [Planctomycetota bacterium]
MTAEGAAECYRRISRLSAKIDGAEQRPHITLHHAPVSNFMELLNAEDWNGISDMIRHSAKILRTAGADFCILPDNTAHHALPMAEVESPLPFLNMVDIVAQTALEDGHSTVGIVGTSYVTRSSTYQATLGLRGLHIK